MPRIGSRAHKIFDEIRPKRNIRGLDVMADAGTVPINQESPQGRSGTGQIVCLIQYATLHVLSNQ